MLRVSWCCLWQEVPGHRLICFIFIDLLILISTLSSVQCCMVSCASKSCIVISWRVFCSLFCSGGAHDDSYSTIQSYSHTESWDCSPALISLWYQRCHVFSTPPLPPPAAAAALHSSAWRGWYLAVSTPVVSVLTSLLPSRVPCSMLALRAAASSVVRTVCPQSRSLCPTVWRLPWPLPGPS